MSPNEKLNSVQVTGSTTSADIENNHKTLGELLPDAAEDARILRKVDWRIVPIMFSCYFLQFLDKVVINYANLMNLQTDLGMTGNDFSNMAMYFFIAFAIAEFPQGYLLQKFPIAKVLGVNVFFWGVTVCCSAASKNFPTMLAMRVLLGCFESVISPSLTLITAMWYTKRQAGPRYGFWYCGLGVGQIIGGLISFAAQSGSITASFGSWRVMMVAVGLVNIGISIVVLLYLPDNVETAKFVTPAEKDAVRRKLALDQGGNGSKVFKFAGLKELFTDAQIWLLLLLTILIVIPSGVITTFSATLIRGFGYTAKQAALLNMPSGIISIASTLICTFAILRGFPRWLSIVLLLIPVLIGAGLMSFVDAKNQGAKLTGIYLINTIVAPLALIYSWTGSNTAGYTKKVAANSSIAIAFSIANIIGPQTFQARDQPQYLPAKITVFGVAGGAMVVATLLRVLYGARNAKSTKFREAQLTEASHSGLASLEADLDLTDRQNPAFVYVY